MQDRDATESYTQSILTNRPLRLRLLSLLAAAATIGVACSISGPEAPPPLVLSSNSTTRSPSAIPEAATPTALLVPTIDQTAILSKKVEASTTKAASPSPDIIATNQTRVKTAVAATATSK